MPGPSSSITVPHVAAAPGWRRWAEPVLAFLVAYAGYWMLAGELNHHDVERFADQMRDNRFNFDIAHVFLQPVTLLWHRHLSFGGILQESQRSISIFSTALAIGVLDMILLALRQAGWRRICICLAVALSYNIIILGPSGHMKLVAFPFLNAAILCLLLWEQHAHATARQGGGGRGAEWLLAVGGIMLTLSASMHASALAAAPFVSLAVVLVAWRAGGTFVAAFLQGTVFGAATLVSFIAIVVFGFITFSDMPPTFANALAAIAYKAGLPPDGITVMDSVGRLMFGTAGNLVAAPYVGPVVRALMHGWATSVTPYLGMLAVQVVPLFLSGLLIAAVYLRGGWGVLQGRRVVMAYAFLLGAQAWPAYYDLNDSEHYFALTVPTLLLVAIAFPPRIVRLVLPVATFLIVATNLAFVGIPTAAYPLYRYTAELRTQLTRNDLMVGFAAYPGGAYMGFLDLPEVPRFRIDSYFERMKDSDALLAEMARQIDTTLAAGGRVLVFDVLDPLEWDAPWSLLYRRGLTKPKLYGFFADRYTIGPEQRMAELKVWQLTPKR